MVRERLANFAMSTGMGLGHALGCEETVELSRHSIDLSMRVPGTREGQAWDSQLYKRGNVFVEGYANPIKPAPVHTADMAEADDIWLIEGETDVSTEDMELGMIPSYQYQHDLDQSMLSQMVNPQKELQKLLYVLVAIIVLQFMTLIAMLYVNGGF